MMSYSTCLYLYSVGVKNGQPDTNWSFDLAFCAHSLLIGFDQIFIVFAS